MLAQVSFKKELIVVPATYTSPMDGYGDMILQIHQDLINLGMSHLLYVSGDSEKTCRNLANENRSLSCVWEASEAKNLPDFIVSGYTKAWHARMRFVARAIRLSYNLLILDVDSIVFSDPYIYLKKPPLSEMHFICNPESGVSSFNINAGFMYVQNVAVDGPVAWAWMDTIRTALLRGDDHYNFSSFWTGTRDNCHHFDQAELEDSIITAAIGRPVYRNAVASCKRSWTSTPTKTLTGRDGRSITLNQAVLNNVELTAYDRRGRFFDAPVNQTLLAEHGLLGISPTDFRMWTGNLTIPNLNYGYPQELGGPVFRSSDSPSGPFSDEWIKTLKDDCPDCPWWNERRPVSDPDPLLKLFGKDGDVAKLSLQRPADEKEMNLFIDPSVKQETMGNMPRYISASMLSNRRGVVLGARAEEKYKKQRLFTVGHIHQFYGGEPRKLIHRKFQGMYNYSLGGMLAARRGETAYEHARKFDQVLALDPAVDLSRIRNWTELTSIVAGLLQLAALSGRTALIPELPCQTQFIHEEKTLKKYTNVCMAPIAYMDDTSDFWPIFYPVDVEEGGGELVGGWFGARKLLLDVYPVDTTLMHPSVREWWAKKAMKAALPGLVCKHCMTGLHAIIMPDFYHWLSHSEAGKKADRKPSPRSLAFKVADGESGLQLKPPVNLSHATGIGGTVEPSEEIGWSWFDRQAAVPVKDVMREMHRFVDEPLVWLSHPIMTVQGSVGDEQPAGAGNASLLLRMNLKARLAKINFKLTLGSHFACRMSRRNFRRSGEEDPHVNLNHGLAAKLVIGEGLTRLDSR
jgi:hypothetical protein